MLNGNNKLHVFGACRLDLENKFLWHNDRPVDLPLKALELLCLLAENQGSVVSKPAIWQTVWPDAFVEETNLTHHIYLLRRKFKELNEPDPIQTVPRRGYRFAVPSNGDHLVIERHAFTQTVIVEISEDEQGGEFKIPRPSVLRKHRLALAAAGAALLTFIGALWGLTRGPSTTPRAVESLAVLPFVSLNESAKDDGIGMADILITRLTSLHSVKVRPTGSVLPLAGHDSVDAGTKLGVDAVLEGTIDKKGSDVRITTRLVRVSDGSVIWADTYQKLAGGESGLQNAIASRVADVLSGGMTPVERDRLSKAYTANDEAWAAYSNARVEWSRRNMAGMLEAQRLFRKAIALDPEFALAYAGLADTLATGGGYREAVSLIDRALELDPDLAEAHASKGFIQLFRNWNWDAAEASLARAMQLNPNYATAHHWHAQVLAVKGRNDEAKEAMRRALELNPVSANFLADIGQIYYFAREYKEAEAYCRRALEIDPAFVFAHEYLHDIYLMTGDYEKAVEAELAAKRSNEAHPSDSTKRLDRIATYLEKQRGSFRHHGIRRFEQDRIEGTWGFIPATRAAFLGDKEAAIEHLEHAFATRDLFTVFAKVDPLLDVLRDEPRYQELLGKLKLE